MRAQRLLSLDLPVLALTDQVARALQVMDELKLMHLAVVEEDVYKGTVSEEALLELDESALIAEAPMTSDAIAPDLHVYDVVARMGWADVDLLPVVEEGLYRGEASIELPCCVFWPNAQVGGSQEARWCSRCCPKT